MEDELDNTAADISARSVAVPARRRPSWAIALVMMAWTILGTILVAAAIRIDLWELAPGEALAVGERLSFEADEGVSLPTRHEPAESMRFVTAFTGRLSALDAFVGMIDPHVEVQTYRERFGDSDPDAQRTLGFQAMYSAQQLAQYVALKHLGIGDPRFLPGPAVVAAVVCEEVPDPASACLRLEVGDRIVEVGGLPTPTLPDVAGALEGRSAGDAVTVTVLAHRSQEEEEREIRLVASNDGTGRVILGIVPADTRQVVLPFQMNISTAAIGGPSAGLAFTLAVIDELSPGELTGGRRAVATGTISETGSVGPIGALVQKAVAARHAGAEIFLVPAAQSPEEIAAARRAGGDRLEIVPVSTLEEALAALVARGGDPVSAVG
jgi:PDZ domain-containing protein